MQGIFNVNGFLYLEGPGAGTAGGGSGGSGTQQIFEGRDPAAPDDPTLPAISFPTGGGTTTQWSVASQAWV